ncbi:hypothetical protein TYRP_020815, partial [Tyrophagus putrescentiae]
FSCSPEIIRFLVFHYPSELLGGQVQLPFTVNHLLGTLLSDKAQSSWQLLPEKVTQVKVELDIVLQENKRIQGKTFDENRIGAVLPVSTQEDLALVLTDIDFYRFNRLPAFELAYVLCKNCFFKVFSGYYGTTDERAQFEHTFSKATVFDQSTLTGYVKASGIVNKAVDNNAIHRILTFKQKMKTGEWAFLKLPFESFIALWKRRLFVVLKKPINLCEEEGDSFVYRRMSICFKIMIISLDEGNRWRVVDTEALAVNQGVGLAAANKFNFVQRGPGGQQLLTVFTRFDEKENKDKKDDKNYLMRQNNVVNSLWSLDLETLHWSCLNTGANSVSSATVSATDPLDGPMTKITTPSLDRLTITANANELLILPRRVADGPIVDVHRQLCLRALNYLSHRFTRCIVKSRLVGPLTSLDLNFNDMFFTDRKDFRTP